MHMQGTPTDMQQNPHYDSITEDVLMFFAEKVDCLKKLGIHDLIIDPGFGFGKAIEHNYQLLKDLKEFNCFALPILIGLSRKSMIYKFFNSSPAESLNGTTVLNTIALLQGANILRVHDVKEGKETVQLVQKCMNDSKTDEYKY